MRAGLLLIFGNGALLVGANPEQRVQRAKPEQGGYDQDDANQAEPANGAVRKDQDQQKNNAENPANDHIRTSHILLHNRIPLST